MSFSRCIARSFARFEKDFFDLVHKYPLSIHDCFFQVPNGTVRLCKPAKANCSSTDTRYFVFVTGSYSGKFSFICIYSSSVHALLQHLPEPPVPVLLLPCPFCDFDSVMRTDFFFNLFHNFRMFSKISLGILTSLSDLFIHYMHTMHHSSVQVLYLLQDPGYHPHQDIPFPNIISNSASLNGGATLFFTTLTLGLVTNHSRRPA